MVSYSFYVETETQALSAIKVGQLFVFADDFEINKKKAKIFIKLNNGYHREIVKEPKFKGKENSLVYIAQEK
jgi:hypothetical protein